MKETLSWVSPCRYGVHTKGDALEETLKQREEKEMHREHLLSKVAFEQQMREQQQARERAEWAKRQRARERKEKLETAVRRAENTLAAEESKADVWKDAGAHHGIPVNEESFAKRKVTSVLHCPPPRFVPGE